MAQEQAEDLRRKYGQLVARAWSDPQFKQRLTADPAAALAEHGIDAPEGVEVRVVEDTDRVVHLVLPPRPDDAELSDDQLALAAGGIIIQHRPERLHDTVAPSLRSSGDLKTTS